METTAHCGAKRGTAPSAEPHPKKHKANDTVSPTIRAALRQLAGNNFSLVKEVVHC